MTRPAANPSTRPSTAISDSLGFADFFNRYLYNALILLAVAACVLRAMRPGRERGAWIALSAGVGCWAVAELVFDFGYGASPEMVRRSLERLDEAGIRGELRILNVFSDSYPAKTQGPVWYAAGKVI